MGDAQTYVFLTGSGRCGSSLVHELLARHPDVGFVSNIDDNAWALRLRGRANNFLYRRVPQAATRKGRLRFAPSEAYKLLAHEVSPIIARPGRTLYHHDTTPWLERRFRDFFVTRANAQAKAVFAHKFTGWPRVGVVQQVFPFARHLHVVRDGRAVANSLVQMPWWQDHREPGILRALGPAYADEWRRSDWSYLTLAGIVWKAVIDAHEDARTKVPDDQWMTVRYEDLLSEPRATAERMVSFLGLPWSPAFEHGFSRMHFATSRADAFERDLDAASRDALERSLGDHLDRYGYVSDPSRPV